MSDLDTGEAQPLSPVAMGCDFRNVDNLVAPLMLRCLGARLALSGRETT